MSNLHAVLREVEHGLFSAEYPGELNGRDEPEAQFPDAHIATSRDSVKMWVEQMAANLGYEGVTWEKE